MPRINPTVTDEAAKIYNSLPHHERGNFVSQAIVRYESAQDIDIRLEDLERRVKELEGKK